MTTFVLGTFVEKNKEQKMIPFWRVFTADINLMTGQSWNINISLLELTNKSLWGSAVLLLFLRYH